MLILLQKFGGLSLALNLNLYWTNKHYAFQISFICLFILMVF